MESSPSAAGGERDLAHTHSAPPAPSSPVRATGRGGWALGVQPDRGDSTSSNYRGLETAGDSRSPQQRRWQGVKPEAPVYEEGEAREGGKKYWKGIKGLVECGAGWQPDWAHQ